MLAEGISKEFPAHVGYFRERADPGQPASRGKWGGLYSLIGETLLQEERTLMEVVICHMKFDSR